MTAYGKTAQTAIAAVSRLAEVYDPDERVKLNSAEIPERCHLSKSVAATALKALPQTNIVADTSGPDAGYLRARSPESITLVHVVTLLKRSEENMSCPYDPEYCGNGSHCPLHFDLPQIRDPMIQILQTGTLTRLVG